MEEDLFGDRCEFWKNIYEQFYQVNIFSEQTVPTKNNPPQLLKFKSEMEGRMMEEKEEGLLMEEEVYEFPEEGKTIVV